MTATSHADPTESATANVNVVGSGPSSLRVSPAVAYLAPGGHEAFSAIFTNHPDTTVTWSVSCGTIDGSGVYTAPATLSAANGGVCSLLAQADSGSLRATALIEIGVVSITSITSFVSAGAQDFAADPIDVQEFFNDDLTATAAAIQPNHHYTATLDMTAGVTSNVLTVAGTASHDGSGAAEIAGSASGLAKTTISFRVTGGRVPWSLVVDGQANATTDAFGQASSTVNYRLGAVHLDPTASITSATNGLLGGIWIAGARDLTGGTVTYESTLTGLTDGGWLTRGNYTLEIYLAGSVQPFFFGPGSASGSGSLTSAFSAGAHP